MRMKRGDLLPNLEAKVTYDDGTDLGVLIDTGTPVTVTIKGRGVDEPIVDKGEAEVTAVSGGVVTVTYPWSAGDTDIPGHYHVELEFTIDGRPMSAPTKGHLHLQIEEDLG